MAGKASDASNTTQLVVCLRWLDKNLHPYAELLGLHSME